MAVFLFYIFAAFGLAYIVGHAAITKPLRSWLYRERLAGPWPLIIVEAIGRTLVDLLECPACFGFWTGVIAVAFGALDATGFWMAVAWGLFTAGTNYTLAKVTRLID